MVCLFTTTSATFGSDSSALEVVVYLFALHTVGEYQHLSRCVHLLPLLIGLCAISISNLPHLPFSFASHWCNFFGVLWTNLLSSIITN